MDIRSPKRRAVDIIDRCAPPHFRPALHAYLDMAGAGDEPRATDMKALQDWWRDYEEACRTFPKGG